MRLQDAVDNLIRILQCRVDFGETPTMEKLYAVHRPIFWAVYLIREPNLSINRVWTVSPLISLTTSSYRFTAVSLKQSLQKMDLQSSLCRGRLRSIYVKSLASTHRVQKPRCCLRYNYSLIVSIGSHRVGLKFDNWKSLTSTEDALRIMQLFCDILQFIIRDAGKIYSEIVGLTIQDQVRFFRDNKTISRGLRACIHELVQVTVDRRSHVPALCAWDSELLYIALNNARHQLVHYLVSLDAGSEVTIGVCMDKSRSAVVPILVILQAGGVIVLLAVQYPLSHITTIVGDPQIAVTLLNKA